MNRMSVQHPLVTTRLCYYRRVTTIRHVLWSYSKRPPSLDYRNGIISFQLFQCPRLLTPDSLVNKSWVQQLRVFSSIYRWSNPPTGASRKPTENGQKAIWVEFMRRFYSLHHSYQCYVQTTWLNTNNNLSITSPVHFAYTGAITLVKERQSDPKKPSFLVKARTYIISILLGSTLAPFEYVRTF